MGFLKKLFGGETKIQDAEKQQEEKDFDILKYDGVRSMKHNQMNYAEKCFTHALTIKDDLEVRDYLSQVYIATNKLNEAHKQLEILAGVDHSNIGIYIRMASVSFLMEDYIMMQNDCEKGIEADSNNAEIYYLCAKSYIGQELLSNAVELLTKAITLQENYFDAYLLRGQTLLKLDNIEEAECDCEILYKSLPDNEEVVLFRVMIEKNKGNYDAAISLCDNIIDLNPFNIQAFVNRGELKQQLGDEKGAEEDKSTAAEMQKEIEEQLKSCGRDYEIENEVNNKYKSIDPYGVF